MTFSALLLIVLLLYYSVIVCYPPRKRREHDLMETVEDWVHFSTVSFNDCVNLLFFLPGILFPVAWYPWLPFIPQTSAQLLSLQRDFPWPLSCPLWSCSILQLLSHITVCLHSVSLVWNYLGGKLPEGKDIACLSPVSSSTWNIADASLIFAE